MYEDYSYCDCCGDLEWLAPVYMYGNIYWICIACEWYIFND